MKVRMSNIILAAVSTAMVCVLGVAPARGQAAPAKPLMAEDVFKNVQVLKGISVAEFMDTMGFFSSSLGLNCTGCHTAESLSSWGKYADDDVPRKRISRTMVQMVNAINKNNFGGRRAVTCVTCHRGSSAPKVIPSLADQYASAPAEDPNEIEIPRQPAPGPSADEILNKYIQAAGGADRLARLTSYTAKGTYSGYDTDFLKAPFEVFAKAPEQRTTIAHTPIGDSTTAFNGHDGWIAAFDKPVPLLSLPPGGDLDGVKLDADLSFPGQIKQALIDWRVGFPVTTINDRDAVVVQGRTAAGSRVKLFFDQESGLLLRQVRFTTTMVGVIPTQVDYSDYREVAGVKLPFKLTVTWTDGQSMVELSDIQPNVAIDPAKFGKPAPVKSVTK